MQLEKDKYTKLLKIIRSIQEKQRKVGRALNELFDGHVNAELWENDVLWTIKCFDNDVYDWFIYHLYECDGKWDVTIGEKKFSWDSDEWFISFLVDNY